MDEFDRQEEPQEAEPEEALVSTEPVDRDSHVAVIHDSCGERYVNVALMLERAPTVSVLRVLGAMNLQPKGEVQYLVSNAQVSQDSRGEMVALESSIFIPGEWQATLAWVMPKVTPDKVRKEGYIKHADVREETAAIPL